jgi:hypothetical protein
MISTLRTILLDTDAELAAGARAKRCSYGRELTMRLTLIVFVASLTTAQAQGRADRTSLCSAVTWTSLAKPSSD